MVNFLYPTQSVRSILKRPCQCGKSEFLTNLNFTFISEFEKIDIYSPSLQQDSQQRFFKCFCNDIPINKSPNFFIEEGKILVNDEMVNDKNFKKFETEIETFESTEELKFLQEYGDRGIFTLDDVNEKIDNFPSSSNVFMI